MSDKKRKEELKEKYEILFSGYKHELHKRLRSNISGDIGSNNNTNSSIYKII